MLPVSRDEDGTGMRRVAAASLVLLLSTVAAAQQAAQPAAPAGERPAQPRIRALLVSGGCCHDYMLQDRILVEAVDKVLPVDWTVVLQGGRGTRARIPLYADADWFKGYDVVVHNECHADVGDPEFIRRITAAHRAGVPAMVIHCAMHSYRAATVDDWREFLGVSSKRHTRQHNIALKIADHQHPAIAGFKPDWVTPRDELYVIDKVWPNARALATAVSPEDQREYPVVWVNEFGGARVFGTTLGHGNDTWQDPVFQDLLVRGFRWAANRD
jgi:type 1 glutamine amidotransferase